MKIYVAGPMSGHSDFNFPAFFAAAAALEALGHEVENPANNDGDNYSAALYNALNNTKGTWADYMRIDIPRLLKCDAVVVLPGWQKSRGASLEVDIATRLGIPLYVLDSNLAIKPRVEVIGLSGYARAGKDTVAKILCDNHGYTRASFADELRTALWTLNPIAEPRPGWRVQDLVSMHGWEKVKDGDNDVRPLLQRMGTEVGRNLFGENFWVDLAFRRIPDGSKVVFSDCRFPNEADAVRNAKGTVWRIDRAGFGAVNDHPSETSLDEYNFTLRIQNDGTLDELSNAVRAAVSS